MHSYLKFHFSHQVFCYNADLPHSTEDSIKEGFAWSSLSLVMNDHYTWYREMKKKWDIKTNLPFSICCYLGFWHNNATWLYCLHRKEIPSSILQINTWRNGPEASKSSKMIYPKLIIKIKSTFYAPYPPWKSIILHSFPIVKRAKIFFKKYHW